ncbi:MAG: hypothetical protein QW666_01010 [Candidatus Woesearchaeota archaeon]
MANSIIRELTPEQKQTVTEVINKLGAVISTVTKNFGGKFNARKKPSSLEKKDLDQPSKAIAAQLNTSVPRMTAKINRLLGEPQVEARTAEFYTALSAAVKILVDLQDYYTYLSENNGAIPQKETILRKITTFIGLSKNVDHLLKYNNKPILEPFEEAEKKLKYTLGQLEK